MNKKSKDRLKKVSLQRSAMEAMANRQPDVDEFEPTVGDKNLAFIEVPPRKYLFHTAEAFGQHEGFLPAGETCILAAPGGCGKTYLALQAAIAAACGGVWLHAQALEPVGVLYLAGENEDELARRFQSILRSMGLSERSDKIELINKNLRLHSRLGKHDESLGQTNGLFSIPP